MVVLLNINNILHIDLQNVFLYLMQDGSFYTLHGIFCHLVSALATFLYHRYQYDRVKRLYHQQKPAKMILKNGWYESEQSQDGGFFQSPACQQVKGENHPLSQSVLLLGEWTYSHTGRNYLRKISRSAPALGKEVGNRSLL